MLGVAGTWTCPSYFVSGEGGSFLAALAGRVNELMTEKLRWAWKLQEMRRTQALVFPVIRLSNTEDLSWHWPWEAEERLCVWLNDGLKDVHVLISRTWECYLAWRKGLCRCDQGKDHEMGDKLGRPGVILRLLIIKEIGGSESENERSQWKQGSEWCRTTSQEIKAAFRSWKRQANEFFPRTSRKNVVPADNESLLTHLGLTTSRTVNKIMLFEAAKLVVICYIINHRKLTRGRGDQNACCVTRVWQ